MVTEANERRASEMKTSGMKKQAEKEGKEKGANFTIKGEGTEKGTSHCGEPLPPSAPLSHQRSQSHSG